MPGSKYVVGEGPDLAKLRAQYADVHFVGQKLGQELAAYLAAADVFVFPSLTDTFGLVLLEAMASGVPVAAFPVTGPLDVVQQGKTGVLDTDLRQAITGALQLNPADCVRFAQQHSWQQCTQRFVSLLEPFEEARWAVRNAGRAIRVTLRGERVVVVYAQRETLRQTEDFAFAIDRHVFLFSQRMRERQ